MKKEVEKKKVKKTKTTKPNQKVATGIPNFDNLIENGFESNSTNLIMGGSGSGKSIFAAQFLITGAKKGENSLYITFEETKKEFYTNMKKFGWDLESLEKQGRFIFLEYTPEKVKTMLEEGGGIIESIIIKNKIQRIVMDSVTSFELLFDKELKKREAALALFSMLRRWDCTTLLTYEADPVACKAESSHALEFESDSITLLYFQRKGKSRERTLEVLKMRGTNHSTEIHPFSIGKNGIIVGKKSIPTNNKK